jgi:hypothetical protein
MVRRRRVAPDRSLPGKSKEVISPLQAILRGGSAQKVKAEDRFFCDLRPLLYREEGTLHPAGIFAALKLGAPLFTFDMEDSDARLNDDRSPRSSAVHPADAAGQFLQQRGRVKNLS